MVTTRASNGKKKQHINIAIPYLQKKRRRQMSDSKPAKVAKTSIPLALRQQVWKTYVGTKFESKCLVGWCTNRITAFEYDVGHNIPESKGGTLDISNLRPICHKCNNSMSNTYTIDEWNKLSKPVGGCGGWCC
jgi:5-methylcytosine-specific restriction endonuclease McrA